MLRSVEYTSRDHDCHPDSWTKSGAIGGNFQLLKIYRFCRSTHLVVPSINNNAELCFQGRKLQSDERVEAPVLGGLDKIDI